MANPNVSNILARTDLSFITTNTINSKEEFSNLDIIENVSVPPTVKANFFIQSNSGAGIGGEWFVLSQRQILLKGNYDP